MQKYTTARARQRASPFCPADRPKAKKRGKVRKKRVGMSKVVWSAKSRHKSFKKKFFFSFFKIEKKKFDGLVGKLGFAIPRSSSSKMNRE